MNRIIIILSFFSIIFAQEKNKLIIDIEQSLMATCCWSGTVYDHGNKEMEIDMIFNLVRAVTRPYPGSFCYIKKEKIFIWKAQIFDRILKYPDAEYGEVVEIFKNRFVVNCLGGLLLINDYEYLNDKIVKLGDILELE